jgi:L-aspartate oxidase
VASTGVHGANRLASNSLLECVVFGKRAAASMIDQAAVARKNLTESEFILRVPADAQTARQQIRETAWQHAGIVRELASMKAGLDILEHMEKSWIAAETPTTEQIETANLRLISELILRSACIRAESRGAHFRTDYPDRNDAQFRCHSVLSLHQAVRMDFAKSV